MKKGASDPQNPDSVRFCGSNAHYFAKNVDFFLGGTDKFDKESSQRKKSGCHT